MALGIFPDLDEDAIYLSRKDDTNPLSSYSPHAFELDGATWSTLEHYYQGTKFESEAARIKILHAGSPSQAVRRGRSRLRKLRKDWSEVKEVVMIRGMYTKARTHAEVADALLETGAHRLVENSQYDYFWGCGRDRRGHNAFGRVLMSVRKKLQEEAEASNN